MSWLSYIFPRTLLITSSKYNQLIRVNEEGGTCKLLVNGSRQSGKFIHRLWSHALNAFKIDKPLALKSILVLGVAGGDVIKDVNLRFPGAEITGVDIDQVMIDIGKKYFGIGAIQNLKIINADAGKFVSGLVRKKAHFDLVVVDIFFGRTSSELTTQLSFLNDLKTLTSPRGIVIINYLRELEYAQKSEDLLDKLKTVFPEVTDTKIERNRFFCCRL